MKWNNSYWLRPHQNRKTSKNPLHNISFENEFTSWKPARYPIKYPDWMNQLCAPCVSPSGQTLPTLSLRQGTCWTWYSLTEAQSSPVNESVSDAGAEEPKRLALPLWKGRWKLIDHMTPSVSSKFSRNCGLRAAGLNPCTSLCQRLNQLGSLLTFILLKFHWAKPRCSLIWELVSWQFPSSV